MKSSIFTVLSEYARDVFVGARSTARSCFTALPYLFSIGEVRKEVTEQYPDPVSSRTADDLPSRTRGLLFNDIDRCTGCKDCEKICPTKCIFVENEIGADSAKVWVAVFDVDFSRCIFCGLCVEVCNPQSLVHTRQFEGAVFLAGDLVSGFGRGRVTREQREKWALLRRQREAGE